MEKNNEIEEVSFKLALKMLEYSDLLEEKKKFVIVRQILRSGTSIRANIKEAQRAESKADFIHNFEIANIKAIETTYWPDLIKASESYSNPSAEIESLLISVLKLLNKIIASSKKGLQ